MTFHYQRFRELREQLFGSTVQVQDHGCDRSGQIALITVKRADVEKLAI